MKIENKILYRFGLKKQINCLLVSPPLQMPDFIYTAVPILTGQLVSNAIKAKNFDLNIKFFKTVLSEEYINKTIELLKLKHIEYDKEKADYLLNNIESTVEKYKQSDYGSEDYLNAEQVLKSVLKFISLPYPEFNLNTIDADFGEAFGNNNRSYKNIKAMTFNTESNIFIDFFEDVIKEIKKQKLDFIGITIPFPATIIPALTFARLLKEKTDITVVLGGNFITSSRILNHPDILDIYCDFVLIGDGEESIVKLAKSLYNREEREKIPGLIYKNKKKEVCFNEPELITNMDNIANIVLDGVNFEEYLSKNINVNIMISKGCYWGKCNFCSIGPKYKRYCIKSPQKVVREIKEIKEKYNINGLFQFQDDALAPLYLDKLADEIIKEKLNINYYIFGRLEKEFTKDLLEKLHKSGLTTVFWGLESGCQNTLNAMNKGIDIKYAERILKDAYDIGICNSVGVIVNFPNETIDDFNETVNFLKKVKKYVILLPGRYTVMRGSIMEKESERFGLKIFDSDELEFNYCPDWQDTNISDEEKSKRWDCFCEFVKNGDYTYNHIKELN